ncbi:MAG: hypothetical protein HHJ17_08265 [Rhodoferax sp.]|uniref:DUF6600 domain-containing protein n=1 Tax=Rhodoferax sp. TaxID=50421 RepID=UPI0017BADDF2|nr:DUF6600 domain-containing protein [Rhodoferax sp.]NMM13515.1 hypothetical protein [Rhodoferax sp.]
MPSQTLRLRALTFVAGAAFLLFSGWANADPPARVARLGYASGAVSFSPAGDNEWVQAPINRPLSNGDRLWTDAGARAEIQVGGAMIRMSAGSSVAVLGLDDRIAQLQLTQGTLNVRVRRLEPNQVFEVDTPNFAFTLRQPGEYRIVVDPDGNASDIIVRKGQGEVYGEGASYVVDSRQPYRFKGTDLRDYEYLEVPNPDEFDRWAVERDRRYDNSASARYVSRDVVGYQDLDANGTWRENATYGSVWVPNRVAAGWAPYRDGHWAWVDPWGWTWVDDAPWGFAVSHYGRWANMGGTWGWVPGPVRTRAYYAPALVAFVGGNNFQLTISSGNVGGVAWFPLAPREVYRPSYTASRHYFENVNRSNTVINNTVIKNTYNTTNVTNVVYANRQVPGAVIAVPRTAFVQSQPVARAAVRVSQKVVASAPVAVIAPLAPTERSSRWASNPGGKPPARVFERSVVARTAPPAVHSGYVAQPTPPSEKSGKPRDDAARKPWKPAVAAAAPSVKVLDPAQLAIPTARPPPVAPAAKPGEARDQADWKKPSAAPAASVAPPAPSKAAVQPQPSSWRTTPPATQAAAAPRGKWEQRDSSEPRTPAVAPPPPPQRAAEPKTMPPQVAPSVPATQGPPPWSAQSRIAPPAQAVRPAPAAPQAVKPAPIPAPRQAEPDRPVAVPPSPPPHPAEPKPVAPKVAPWTAATPAQPPSVPPRWNAAPQNAAPAAPATRPAPPAWHSAPPANPEPAAAARPAEPRPPVAAPKAPPPPPAQAAPKSEHHVQKPKPDGRKPGDGKNDNEDPKR